jgi:phosphomannomutase
MLYFSTFFGNAIAGIMVTGSHNPPEYNGFKFIFNRQPFFGEQIQNLHSLACKYLLSEHEGIKKATSSCLDFSKKYLELLFTTYPKNASIKVAWDPGHGAAADILARLCGKLPGSHVLINGEVNGDFPSHHPDPTVPANLEQLINVVKREHCHLGIAFDGDGDRIGLVDSHGRIMWGDQLLNVLAQDLLQRNPGASVIADVKSSDTLFSEIKKLGGVPIMCKTGHSHIKKAMKDTGALLAGEMSGHVFMAENYFGYDDALYTAMRLIELLVRNKTSLAQLLDSMPKVCNTPEIRIECPEYLKFKIIDEVKGVMRSKQIQFMDIDGIRCTAHDGWWLLRASNTQNVLVCRFEASSDSIMKEQQKLVANLLLPYKDALKCELLFAS